MKSARYRLDVAQSVHKVHLPLLWRQPQELCEPECVSTPQPTRSELEELIAALREEVARLKEEIRRLRRDNHEVPPHYL